MCLHLTLRCLHAITRVCIGPSVHDRTTFTPCYLPSAFITWWVVTTPPHCLPADTTARELVTSVLELVHTFVVRSDKDKDRKVHNKPPLSHDLCDVCARVFVCFDLCVLQTP